jgi:CRP-like cAMP-binding protein
MFVNDDSVFGLVIRKLNRLAPLERADIDAIRSLPFKVGAVGANRHIVREGDVVSECCVLLSGYACRHKTTSNGGRQIVSFHLPGDILDLQHLLFSRADHNLQTITAATIARVPVAELSRIVQERPALNNALWRDTLIDASIFREWVLNVGRRDGKTRIAHMLCEFASRRAAAGLGSPQAFEMPMTQEQIGDATGLTAVHVNRVLQELGRDGVIARDKRKVQIADWQRMCRVGDFDPTYLHAAAA